MHVAHLLSQWLSNHTVIGHRAREAALLKLVHALLNGSKLSLTQLGRHRAGSAYEKHHIKAADRLLANRHLHAERDGIYRAIPQTPDVRLTGTTCAQRTSRKSGSANRFRLRSESGP